MQSLFHIHPTPDKVAALVLQHMYANLSVASSGSGNSSSAEEEGDGSTQLQQQQQQQSVCALARLLFVLGQTSLCSLVYTEFLAACAKKYPVKDADTGKKTAADASKAGGNKKGDGTRETGAFKEDSGAVDAMEEEMGAAAAADADHERVCAFVMLHFSFVLIQYFPQNAVVCGSVFYDTGSHQS